MIVFMYELARLKYNSANDMDDAIRATWRKIRSLPFPTILPPAVTGCYKMLAHCESSNCLHHERPLLNPIDTAERSSHAFEDLPSMLHTQAPVLHRNDYGKLVDEE
ncbi:hypothetical protein D5086_030964 [Populus alba]|uniref:Uncharacterized protein n=1 Tax=Populus alba TaxID=43335 RepID=A0ACC4AQ18_POPAL